MASITTEKATGRRTIQFRGADGKRRSIRLGKVSKRQADRVRLLVEDPAGAAWSGGSVSDETARFMADAEDDLRDKLARVGLIRQTEAATLAAFMDTYLAGKRPTVKPGTMVRLNQAKLSLVRHLGADRRLRDVTEGDAADFRSKLIADGLAEATVRKRCGDARMIFRAAMRHGLIRSNPFASDAIPCSAIGTKHHAYIGDADARKVSNALPDASWRLLFALARWGGLRVVSEPRALEWGHVDWERNRLNVPAPKTAHIAGHESRVIPIFPELAPLLREVFEQAPEGERFVLPMLQHQTSAALRKPMLAAIKRAGVKPWRRLWHNLRSTRQTELEQTFPSHVVCAWLGNNRDTARRHYLQVTEDHFTEAVQNPVQQAHATPRNGSHEPNAKRDCSQAIALGGSKVTPTGFEPVLPG